MIILDHRLSGYHSPHYQALLPFHLRQKSRLRVTLNEGTEAAILLPKGTMLRHGDLLGNDQGVIVEICAAQESVSTIYIESPIDFARICYHLGNRHISLQIGDMWLRYLRDHVIDNMACNLGFKIINEMAAFEPESGAYSHAHQ